MIMLAGCELAQGLVCRLRGGLMRRRDAITLLGALAAGPSVMQPLSAQAQQTKRVGMLWNGEETLPSIRENFAAVEQALAKLGWVAGRNIYFETRYNGG